MSEISFNGKTAAPDSTATLYRKRRSDALLSFYMGKGQDLSFNFTIPAGIDPVVRFREYSFDLLENEKFEITQRPNHMMPKPFIVNDAIILERAIQISELSLTETILDPTLITNSIYE